jgi:4'-phosphopantetheinyl transferase
LRLAELRAREGEPLPKPLVQVWTVNLDDAGVPAVQLAQLLSPDEQHRAARFRFERDRQRYVVGRGALRVLLGAYLDRSPGQVKFVLGASGKPALESQPNGSDLHFNLAHAGGHALYAFTRAAEVGVDLENLRPVEEMQDIADRFFAAPESAALRELPNERRAEIFFRVWTRKEAVIKAVGEGLSRPLDHFTVAPTVDSPLELRWLVQDATVDGTEWSLHHLDPGPGLVGALAVRCAHIQVAVQDLDAEQLKTALLQSANPSVEPSAAK